MDRERTPTPQRGTARRTPERPAQPDQLAVSRSSSPATPGPRLALPATDTFEAAPPPHGAAAARDADPPRRRVSLRQQIRTILASPTGVRQALLLNEILGTPKALRKRDER